MITSYFLLVFISRHIDHDSHTKLLHFPMHMILSQIQNNSCIDQGAKEQISLTIVYMTAISLSTVVLSITKYGST